MSVYVLHEYPNFLKKTLCKISQGKLLCQKPVALDPFVE